MAHIFSRGRAAWQHIPKLTHRQHDKMGGEQSAPEPVKFVKVVCGTSRFEQNRTKDLSKCASPLHVAAANGDELEVRRLVRAHAHVNAVDAEGRTPFIMACKYGKLQTARMLVRLGANPDLRDISGRTAKDVSFHKHVKEWLARYLPTRRLSVEGDMQFHNCEFLRTNATCCSSSTKSSASGHSSRHSSFHSSQRSMAKEGDMQRVLPPTPETSSRHKNASNLARTKARLDEIMEQRASDLDAQAAQIREVNMSLGANEKAALKISKREREQTGRSGRKAV